MFDVFYYKNGNKSAQYIAYKMLEKIEEFNNFFDFNLDIRLQIVFYNTLSHLKQSNLNDYNDNKNNETSLLNLKEDKIIIHGTGNFNDITKQLVNGLVKVYLKSLLGNNQLNNQLNKAYSLKNLPDWFIEGIVLYISLKNKKDYKTIYRIVDMINQDDFDQLNHIDPQDNAIIGYSIWEFINHKYGSNALFDLWKKSLLLMDIEKAFEITLNKSYDDILNDRKLYFIYIYKNLIDTNKDKENNYLIESSEDENINQISLSNDAKMLAYVVNQTGEFNINILNIATSETKTIYEGGYKIPLNEDKRMPIISFHPNNKILVFVTEEDALTKFHIYDIETDEIKTRKFLSIDRILNLSFSQKGDKITFSAIKKGLTDIFVYNLKTKVLNQITQDSYIDLEPVFFNKDNYIAFKSNRNIDSLKKSNSLSLGKENFDIFIYDYKTKSNKLKIATNNNITKSNLRRLNSNKISYLMFDKTNKNNLYSSSIDSTISYIDTAIHYKHTISNHKIYDNPSNTLDYDISTKGKMINLKMDDNSNKVSIIDMKSLFNDKINMAAPEKNYIDNNDKRKPNKNYAVSIDNYKFSNHILKKLNLKEPISKDNLAFNKKNDVVIKSKEFNKFKRLYETLFFASSFQASLYDEFNAINYQVFTGGPAFLRDPFSGFLKLDLKDPFENYVLTFAFKSDFVPVWGVSLSPNTSIGVSLYDKSSFIKHKYSLYRKSSFSIQNIISNLNVINSKIQYDLIYPFNPISSLRFETGLRRDEVITLSKEYNSAKQKTAISNNIFFRTSYIYDNVINIEKNIYRGLRFKVFGEIYQGFEKDRQTMINLGLDARYYLRLYKSISLSNRLAYGTSISSQKLIYYIGGTDNELINRFNNEIPISKKQNYGFQTLMTNMRGFEQNIRNGNNFIILNTEIRIPIFNVFSRYPIKFSFIKNFQIIPFFDIGTAWTGISPWSKENEFNSLVIKKENMTITIDRQQNPIVFSFGVGFRTLLFGQFIRVDYGTGVNTGEILKSLIHFSIAFDF